MRHLLLCALWLPALAAADIYRWTDAQGGVHFGERPERGATQVEVKPQVVERDAATRAREERLERLQEARRQEQAQASADTAQRLAKREQSCRQLRNQLASIGGDRRYFSRDSKGEAHYYSSAEIDAARRTLSEQVASHCS
ncbi:DUF4124 domain-containing protein [Pseudomonas sp. RIT-PI-AD]|uniref:DUF4124 domain-containing protein n=1 Tax=Pseudomonas sp. RIT-PI-AD TaxID=3035294 RepID=UPI0021D7D64C|nr:DUF4124 domain-containing protein [Pseudomonas sp. RIT-PI-AD]